MALPSVFTTPVFNLLYSQIISLTISRNPVMWAWHRINNRCLWQLSIQNNQWYSPFYLCGFSIWSFNCTIHCLLNFAALYWHITCTTNIVTAIWLKCYRIPYSLIFPCLLCFCIIDNCILVCILFIANRLEINWCNLTICSSYDLCSLWRCYCYICSALDHTKHLISQLATCNVRILRIKSNRPFDSVIRWIKVTSLSNFILILNGYILFILITDYLTSLWILWLNMSLIICCQSAYIHAWNIIWVFNLITLIFYICTMILPLLTFWKLRQLHLNCIRFICRIYCYRLWFRRVSLLLPAIFFHSLFVNCDLRCSKRHSCNCNGIRKINVVWCSFYWRNIYGIFQFSSFFIIGSFFLHNINIILVILIFRIFYFFPWNFKFNLIFTRNYNLAFICYSCLFQFTFKPKMTCNCSTSIIYIILIKINSCWVGSIIILHKMKCSCSCLILIFQSECLTNQFIWYYDSFWILKLIRIICILHIRTWDRKVDSQLTLVISCRFVIFCSSSSHWCNIFFKVCIRSSFWNYQRIVWISYIWH